jgi:hypothetical protein
MFMVCGSRPLLLMYMLCAQSGKGVTVFPYTSSSTSLVVLHNTQGQAMDTTNKHDA